MPKELKAKTQPVSVRLDTELVEKITRDGVPITRVIEVALRQWAENNEDEKVALLVEYIDSKTWSSAGQALGIPVDKKTLMGLPLLSLGLMLTPGISSVVSTLEGTAGGAGGASFAGKALHGLTKLMELAKKTVNKE